MKIQCIAIDDEPLALEKMQSFIKKIDYLELQASFDNGMEALFFLKQQKVDLVFLDIQMDELDGLQFLELLNPKPHIILTTAYHEYAMKGYELSVSDYLLKPIRFKRFEKAVDRVKHTLSMEEAVPQTQYDTKDKDHFFVRSDYQLIKINVNNIVYLEAEKEYVIIHCTDKSIRTRRKIRIFEEELPTPPFFRIHKSFIISFKFLSSVGSGHVEVNGQQLPLGDFYKTPLMEYMKVF